MADVVICHAPENEATLRQLADAVAHAGYDVWHGGADAPDATGTDAVTDQVAAAKAVIVIWSEAAASSEWVKAEANVARGLKKLVQVSADGRPPPIPFDRADMVSVLTWRGEQDHPAWRGIAASLLTLCGPPPERTVLAKPPAAAIPAAVPAPAPAPPAPAPPPAADDSTPAPGPNKGLIVLIVLLVLAALAAAWYWLREPPPAGPAPSLELNMAAAPEAAPPSAPPPAAPEPAAETFDRRATIQGVDHADVLSAPSAMGFNIARVEPGEVFATYEQEGDWWRVRTASGRTGYMNMALIRLRDDSAAPAPAEADPGQPTRPARIESRPERRAEPRRPRASRIRKENSEVMEAFCSDAGAGTPQCRDFRRSGY